MQLSEDCIRWWPWNRPMIWVKWAWFPGYPTPQRVLVHWGIFRAELKITMCRPHRHRFLPASLASKHTAVLVKLVSRLSWISVKEMAMHMCAVSLHLLDPQSGLVLPDWNNITLVLYKMCCVMQGTKSKACCTANIL